MAAPATDPAKDERRVHDAIPAEAANPDCSTTDSLCNSRRRLFSGLEYRSKSGYGGNRLHSFTAPACEPVYATRSLCVTPESKKARQVPRSRRSCRALKWRLAMYPASGRSRRYRRSIAVSDCSHFYDDPSSDGQPLTPQPKLSPLDGKLRHQLYLACEHFGSARAFCRQYGVNITETERAMERGLPIRGAVLMAVIAWALGDMSPIIQTRQFRFARKPRRTRKRFLPPLEMEARA